jgi:site-specific DNA recombinase
MNKEQTATRKQVIGYCRVSTENQKDEGTIDLQRQALIAYAEAKGFELVVIFEDEGISGGLEDRPALADLFNYLEDKKNKDIEAVLIYKLDRLARDLYIQEHLIKKLESLNKGLISTKEPDLASGDPMRKAFRQFMGIVAELEKAFITMRLSAGRISKIKTKKQYAGGGKALGYNIKGKDLIIDQKQAETIRRIFKLRRNSHKSLWEIARELNAQSIPTARGGKWHAGTVKYILDNRLYKGVMGYSGVEAERGDLALL